MVPLAIVAINSTIPTF